MAVWYLGVSYLVGKYTGRKFRRYWLCLVSSFLGGILSTVFSMLLFMFLIAPIFFREVNIGKAIEPYIFMMPLSIVVTIVTATMTWRKIRRLEKVGLPSGSR